MVAKPIESMAELAAEIRRANTPTHVLKRRGAKDAKALGLTRENFEYVEANGLYWPQCPRCGGSFKGRATVNEAWENLQIHLGWGEERCAELKAEMHLWRPQI